MMGGLRTRATLERYATVLVVACVVLAAAGAFVAYGAHGTPNTTTETRTVDEWRLAGSFTHEATVRENANTTAFEPGSTVGNRSTYFMPVMPELDGEFALAYESEDRPVGVRLSRRVVVRSVEPTPGEDGRAVYWTETRSLAERTTTLRPDERATVPFALNVSETFAAARNESDRLGDPGMIQVLVVVDVTATRRTAEATNRSVSFVLPVTGDGSLYRVEDDPRTARYNRTTTATVADPPGPLRAYGGPIAFVGGLGGALALVVARRRDLVGVTAAERAYLAYRDDRADYADWITSASLPESALDRQRVVVDTLADLADVAIDAGERVVHDADRGTYVVVHDDYAYTFQPPADPRETVENDVDRDADPANVGGERDVADALDPAATTDGGNAVDDAFESASEVDSFGSPSGDDAFGSASEGDGAQSSDAVLENPASFGTDGASDASDENAPSGANDDD
jgi:hypothetical protein